MMKRITDNIHHIESEEALRARMEGWKYWDDYGTALWHVVDVLRSDMRDLLETRHEEKLAKQRDAREKKRDDEVRAYNASFGLTNVKRVVLLVPQAQSDTTPPSSPSTAHLFSAEPALKIRDINSHNLPALHSGVKSDSFYATKSLIKKRKRTVVQPHNSSSPPKRL